MRSFLKKYYIKKILKKNKIIINKTNTTEVLSLIERLRPQNVGLDLIRLGSDEDGGYLIPDDLDNLEACFSPGVHQISDFDKACSDRGMHLYLADKTIEKPNLDIDSSKFTFLKKHIGTTSNSETITLDDWANSSLPGKGDNLILQMDIEGAEYFSLINISDALINRFRIIIIEFHSLEKLWNPEFYNIALEAFNKVLKHHTCVHIHPNNDQEISKEHGVEIPRVAEFTFIHNSRIKDKTPTQNFPNPLDFDNNPAKPHVVLPEIWYKS